MEIVLKVPGPKSLENEFSLKLADRVTFPTNTSSMGENGKYVSHL